LTVKTVEMMLRTIKWSWEHTV